MSTPAQLQLLRDVFESLALVCDELVNDFPAFGAAAAHYFRHGAAGRVPAPLDEDEHGTFVAAFETKLKQKKRGMGVLLEANIADLLVDGEAFHAGDPLAPDAVDALADVPPAGPAIPMSLLIGRRVAKKFGKVNAYQLRLRLRVWEIMTAAAVKTLMQHQLTVADAANAHQPMQVPLLQLPAVFAAGVAMRYADRVQESKAVAVWNFAVHRVQVIDVEGAPSTGRLMKWPCAVVSVVFEHDDSAADLLFTREIPTLLDDWLKAPEPKEPLRVQHFSPMRVLGSAATHANARRVFAITNIPEKPVAAARAQDGVV